MSKLNLLVFSLLLIAPLCAELSLRLSFVFKDARRGTRAFMQIGAAMTIIGSCTIGGLESGSPRRIGYILCLAGRRFPPPRTTRLAGTSHAESAHGRRAQEDHLLRRLIRGWLWSTTDQIPNYMDRKIASADVLNAGNPIEDLYLSEGFHHDLMANQVIGDAIVAYLNGLGYE